MTCQSATAKGFAITDTSEEGEELWTKIEEQGAAAAAALWGNLPPAARHFRAEASRDAARAHARDKLEGKKKEEGDPCPLDALPSGRSGTDITTLTSVRVYFQINKLILIAFLVDRDLLRLLRNGSWWIIQQQRKSPQVQQQTSYN